MPKKKKTNYHKQREEFYKKHTYIKYLLGLLAISFVVYIGVQFQNIKKRQYVMLQLLEEGIDPNFADL